MPRIAIGTPVEVDGLRGVVVGHRPQGMVDVQPEGEDFIIRKRESALRRLNPKRSKKAKKTVSRRSEVHRQHIEKTPKAGAQGSKKGKKGYQRKEKHKTRYNPEKGSPPLRVRREVEKMLHDPPSSWRALYKRAGLPARPSVEDFIDIVRSKTPSGRSAEAHYGREMGKGKHVPTRAVREAALLGLRLSYDNNYTSQSGVGLARAVQLVLDPSIDDLAKTRMRAYLTRHEKDKQGKNFGNLDRPSNGYMAWLNWGGDPAKEWLGMRDNPFFGFGRKRQPKPQVDPRDSFEDAIDLYAEYGRTADEVLVLACNQKGTGAAWYWLPGHQGLSVRAFERASARSIPKRYITTKDPTSTVISNLQEYRNPGRVTYIHVNAFTGEVTGPFKGSEVLPAAANPRSRKPDVIEKQDAQLVAVVQGIYESLMAKRLGVKSIYPPQGGERLDSMMIRMGTLSREEQREILSRAFAIATQQGQKHGYLRPKSQKPTAKGRRRAYKRQEDAAALEQNRQDYETTLALARKSASLRVVQKGRGSSKRFFVLPHVEGVNKRGYKTQRGAENAMERVLLRSNPSGPLGTLMGYLNKDSPKKGRIPSDVSREAITTGKRGNIVAQVFKRKMSKFKEWAEQTPEEDLIRARERSGLPLDELIDRIQKRGGLTPVEAARAAAFAILRYATTQDSRKVQIALAFVADGLSSGALREFFGQSRQLMTPEMRAQEERVARAVEGGRRVVPKPIGDSDLQSYRVDDETGDIFRVVTREEGVRQSQMADARRQVRPKSRVRGVRKAGDSEAGVYQRARSESGTFETPGLRAGPKTMYGVQDLVDTPTIRDPNDPKGRAIKGEQIEYTITSSGKLKLSFGGYTYWASIPSNFEPLILNAKTPEDAIRMMQALGRPIHGAFNKTAEGVFYEELTPTQLQSMLNGGEPIQVAANYRQLANIIVEFGTKAEREEFTYLPPSFGLAFVTGKDGKEFQTFVVYGQGRANAVRRVISGKFPGMWVFWKDAVGRYTDVREVEELEESERHVVLVAPKRGSKKEWYVYGPLSKYGSASTRGTRAYEKEVREYLKASDEEREQYNLKLPEPPPMFRFKRKRDATATARALNERFARKRALVQKGLPGAYGYYLKKKFVGSDKGYQAAAALSEALREEGIFHASPVPPRSAKSVPGGLLQVGFMGYTFQNFPTRTRKGEKIDLKEFVGITPPVVYVVSPGAASVPYTGRAIEQVIRGNVPYSEAGVVKGTLNEILNARTDPPPGFDLGSSWTNLARRIARDIELRKLIEREHGKESNEYIKASKDVRRSIGKANKLLNKFGLLDRPVVIFYGTNETGGINMRERRVVGPATFVGDVRGTTRRQIAQQRKGQIVVRQEYKGGVGTQSDKLDALAYLLSWNPKKIDPGSFFSKPLFAAQVFAFLAVERALTQGKDEQTLRFLRARALNPVSFMANAAKKQFEVREDDYESRLEVMAESFPDASELFYDED